MAKVQLRRGTASQWTTANPTLSVGEVGFETDTGKFKIGTGSSAWASLSYTASDKLDTTAAPELVRDTIGAALVAGTGIKINANDGTDAISITGSRPLSSLYRPLAGYTSDVAVTALAGLVEAATVYPWADSPASYPAIYTGYRPWRYCGAQMTKQSSTQGYNFCDGVAPNTFSIEFNSDATDLRFTFTTSGRRDFWIMQDGRLVNSNVTTSGVTAANVADGTATIQITQPTAVMHRWRIGIPLCYFQSVSTNAGARITPTEPAPFRLALVGASLAQGGLTVADSIATGTSCSMSANYLPGQIEQLTGGDVYRMCEGSTGYVAQGSYGANGPYGSTARINALTALTNLTAMVVWTVGQNDLPGGLESEIPAVITAANACWTAMATAQPGVPLIVAGCIRQSDSQIGTVRETLNTALKNAANAHASVTAFIDFWADNPFNGTGNWASPAGNGNADTAIISDGQHVTLSGARMLGRHFASRLGKILIPA